MTTARNKALLTFTAYAFFFLSGFFINIGGAITNTLASTLGVTTAFVGFGFMAFMVGRVVGISGNGILFKKRTVNRDIYIRGAVILMLAVIAGLLTTSALWQFTAWIFVAGAMVGMLYSSSNMILVDLYEGKSKAFHISMINFLYSAGGVTSPFLAGLILKNGYAWNRPYLMPAAVIIVFIAVTARARFSALYVTHEDTKTEAEKPVFELPLLMVSLSIVCYIMAEYSITYWMPVYMREALGKDVLFAGTTVSAFWIAVLAGRFAQSMLIARIRPRLYLIASGLAAVVCLLVLRTLTNDASILVFSALSGFFCSGLFPGLFIFGSDRAEHIKHTFPTLMMLSAASGSFLAMPAGSIVKDTAGIDAILLTPAVAIAIMVALVIASGSGKKKTQA